jgi:hypothetical protein
MQLRFGGDGARRWIKSVYSGPATRRARVAVEDMVPAERDGYRRPDGTRATTILFVIDLTNAAPGSAGELAISDLALALPQAPGCVDPPCAPLVPSR